MLFCTIIFYLLQVIETGPSVRKYALAIGLGFIWLLDTSLIVNNAILTVAMFGGVALGILIVFIYRIVKRRINKKVNPETAMKKVSGFLI